MSKIGVFVVVAALSTGASGSWYWPFGSDDEKEEPRLSELIAPASTNIDAAVDFAADGKVDEAIECYERALVELDRLETTYPDRMEKPEFTTVKTKRAYVRTAMDSLKFKQVQENSKAVAVSDTTELERKLAEEKAAAATAAGKQPSASSSAPARAKQEPPVVVKPQAAVPSKALTRSQRIAQAIDRGDYAEADAEIAEVLRTKPNDAAALNLRAMMESAQGRWRDAERTLDQAINSNPKSYHAYFNMARLIMKANPANKDGARRYYETGRSMGGGPANAALEEAVK